MRRQNLFSFEQQRIIYTKHLSGESQHALAKQFGVSQSVIFGLIKKQSLVDSEYVWARVRPHLLVRQFIRFLLNKKLEESRITEGILEAKTEMILPQSMVHFTSIIDMQTDTKM